MCTNFGKLGFDHTNCLWKIFWTILNPFITETVLQITLFFTCSNTGELICNYLLDDANSEQEFSTMNRQDGHLQFDTKRNNLRPYAHSQLCLEQAKVERGGRALYPPPPINLYMREKYAKTSLLCKKINSLPFAIGFESIRPLISGYGTWVTYWLKDYTFINDLSSWHQLCSPSKFLTRPDTEGIILTHFCAIFGQNRITSISR
jgi:hypothetical protein